MLEYERIDVSEGIDVKKKNQQFAEAHYLSLLALSQVKFQISGGFHDLMQKALSFNDVKIVSVKENDYRIFFGT